MKEISDYIQPHEENVIDVRYKGRTLEGLNEELDEETYFDFEHEIYGALAGVIEKFPGVTANEIERALENFDIRFFEDNDLFDTVNNSTSSSSIDYVNQYELNVLTHVRELEDEGEYEDAEDFRDNFPRLIDYSESGSKITLKFDKPLNKSDLIPYLMYVPKDFSDESEAAAKAINDTTIVIDNALNEALNSNATSNSRKLNEHISDSAAQKYGYRNAAELRAANKINK